ncbi:hypothetical protein AUEXF2481DRAFT_609 [Aureobasidium subglaciale EXF-2481]|uniref:Uncharacterized protein n=1 Tax=Aureobasidium subglaciale (strain EXF-2481) TaxID=1043005 RepID=A0A074Z355_AURSE|nr:uncharacterized protein AUEXF2481DRAFT_609 [Aureobasidium subglaciale EXF-2481]KAI5210220.1 hypothetical protein E4T38_02083 [Aureobasidium subglaciale]KAI5228951.1 hypothetical protein E4T40_01811 [Aureobasidium subglaciale]KAI5232717.1 hypothetical protein E4T41_02031 [Aureobasidium subglaciale]KAI5265993.1 hypothetical protein E4T46_01860 [Aureobasidium subglaciale]KER00703.1 hypothetical protein AUEXF2481DRAFT_609 [Aureobasidium subglaciale EXF-2481]
MEALTDLEVSNLHIQDPWFEAIEPLTLTEACQIGRETRASSIEEFDESEFEQNPFPFVGERVLRCSICLSKMRRDKSPHRMRRMPNMLSSLIDMDKRGSSSDESVSTNNSNSSTSSSVTKRVAEKVARSFFTLMLCGSNGDSTTSSTQAAPLPPPRPTTLKGLDLYYPPSVSYNSNETLHSWTGEDIKKTPSVLTNFNTNIWQQTRRNSKASIKSLLSTSSTSTTQPSPLESPLESPFEQANPIERREWNIDEDTSPGSSISMDGPSDYQGLVRGLAEIRKLREVSAMASGPSIPRRYTADW